MHATADVGRIPAVCPAGGFAELLVRPVAVTEQCGVQARLLILSTLYLRQGSWGRRRPGRVITKSPVIV